MTYLESISDNKRLVGIIVAILVAFYLLSYLPESIAEPMVKEDGPIENLTAIFFLITSVAFLMLFFSGKYIKNPEIRAHFSSKAKRWVFLIFGLIFFFGFGEEISWGQRIFGFGTPESLAESNAQNEFNIHNLEVFNIRDVDGNRKEGLSKLFTSKQLFLYCFFTFLVLIPFLDKFDNFKSLFRRLYIPVPSLFLGVLFIGNYIIYRIFRAFSPMELNKELTEIQEMNFSLILLLIPFTWMMGKYLNKIKVTGDKRPIVERETTHA